MSALRISARPLDCAAAGLVVCSLVMPVPLAAVELPTSIPSLTEGEVRQAFSDYRELLSLPNDAHSPGDILAVIAWLERALTERGFTTERLPTPGSDLLLAQRGFEGARRTVLVYLQADGQPVDPRRWDQADPFSPVLKERTAEGGWREIDWSRLDGPRDDDWRIFARSASDSKGPVTQFLTALAVLDRLEFAPDFAIKVIVDTEEEIGSPHLPPAVRRFRERLQADMLVIFDGPPHSSGRPTLSFGARGIATATLTTYGPRVPQHSGHYGNYVPNPALRLAQLLASMKDPEGRVVIDGWYDGVVLDAEARKLLGKVPDDEEHIRRQMGVAGADAVAPTLQEAIQYPSLNIRGLQSGWVGDQVRTIIPATATAEIDVRLVIESDAEKLLELLVGHIEAEGYHVIDGEPSEDDRRRFDRLASLTWEISYGAFRTDLESEPGLWLSRAMHRLYGEDPIKIRTLGGSIPISPFVQTLGIPAVVVPTVNPDNNQHSPNENLRVGDFLEGVRKMLAILTQPLEPEG